MALALDDASLVCCDDDIGDRLCAVGSRPSGLEGYICRPKFALSPCRQFFFLSFFFPRVPKYQLLRVRKSHLNQVILQAQLYVSRISGHVYTLQPLLFQVHHSTIDLAAAAGGAVIVTPPRRTSTTRPLPLLGRVDLALMSIG